MFPYDSHYSPIRNKEEEATYYGPKHTFQLSDDLDVLFFETMLSHEPTKVVEVTLVPQNLGTKIRLSHLAVEVGRCHPVELATMS